MMKIIKDWFTSRNGVDWSFSKLVALGAGCAMGYKFVTTASTVSPDYTGFGVAITGIIAALAYKYSKDEPQK